MKFIDSTKIKVRSGNGGAGIVSFRTARNRPKLGADGGNGGNGGDVYLVADKGLNTLNSLRYRQLYKAEHGEKGGSNVKTGRCGDSLEIPVPLGTIAYNDATGEMLGELLHHSDKLLLAKGGKRGYGNYHFLKDTHQAPRESLPGELGIELEVSLELKVLADVGLAGFPNAGKSTFLSRMSAARPKIADYPFTTLAPNLGVVDLSEFGKFQDSFVIADIPGLIEGASEGKGLGHAFLKHLERTRVILYIIDAFDLEETDPVNAFIKLRQELEKYDSQILSRKTLILVNKIDLAPSDFDTKGLEGKFKLIAKDTDVLFASGATGEGLIAVKQKLYEILSEQKCIEEAKNEEIQFLSSLSHLNDNGENKKQKD
ncbi:MAG: GTPase ObgE [Bdellovibrionota bacterium]